MPTITAVRHPGLVSSPGRQSGTGYRGLIDSAVIGWSHGSRSRQKPAEEEQMKKFARGAVAGAAGTTAHPPGGLHREPELTSAKDQQKARALGLTSATGLVIGTVIGAGVFTMPAVLAGAGTISLAVLAVIAVGAMVLAVLFGQLTGRV